MSEPATPSHYFDARPPAASARRSIRLDLPDLSLVLATDRGVFSPDAIDAGTKLLLLEAPPPAAHARNVADVGCGYGAIALTLAARAPQATVWAIDVNERALALCRDNAVVAGCAARVIATTPSDVPAHVVFDVIYSNPPIRIGKDALHRLLSTWLGRLAPEGRAYLVVHKNLGADSLTTWLRDQRFAVNRLISRRGYRILEVAR